MADQNITALPKKTASGLAATDYLLGIDSAEGYQMLIQDLGDYIIQHATSSLAGSSQTLASAIAALNSKLASKTVRSGSMNDLVEQGYYFCSNAVSDAPETEAYWRLRVEIYGGAPSQYAYKNGATDVSYYRHKSNNVWSVWYALPTRAEVDALNSNLMIVPNSPIDIPADTTSFDVFDSVITSLGAFQGKIFEVQVSAGVNLGGVVITGGRKICQIIRHSGTDHAAIYMFGWAGQDDRYFLTKTTGTWSCSKLPSRSEITALNNSIALIVPTTASVTEPTEEAFRSVVTQMADQTVRTARFGNYTGQVYRYNANYASGLFHSYAGNGRMFQCCLVNGTFYRYAVTKTES